MGTTPATQIGGLGCCTCHEGAKPYALSRLGDGAKQDPTDGKPEDARQQLVAGDPRRTAIPADGFGVSADLHHPGSVRERRDADGELHGVNAPGGKDTCARDNRFILSKRG